MEPSLGRGFQGISNVSKHSGKVLLSRSGSLGGDHMKPVSRSVAILLLGIIGFCFGCAHTRIPLVTTPAWELSFDKDIQTFAIDEDCYKQAGDVGGCLRWVLLEDRKVHWLGRDGKSSEAVGDVFGTSVSPGGRFFLARTYRGPYPTGTVLYSLFDWTGNKVWETEEGYGQFTPRDNGTSAFARLSYRTTAGWLWAVKSFSGNGELTDFQSFGRKRFPSAPGPLGAISDSFYAIVSVEEGGLGVWVFDVAGSLAWSREGIVGRRKDEEGRPLGYMFGGIVVSDHGEVVLYLSGITEWPYQVMTFDRTGCPRDTFFVGAAGRLSPAAVTGSLVFISTHGTAGGRGVLFCYDLEVMKLKFLVEADNGTGFGHPDVDKESGLVAVSVRRRGDSAVRVYDLKGNLKAQVVPGGTRYFRARLLDEALLLAEGKVLRLYDLNVGKEDSGN